MPSLFDPITVGDLLLPNRVIMAPLTRCRASEGRVPNDLMCEYYRQRASAGLILSEATAIDPSAVGYPDTPGIWSEAQVQGWQKVTDAVHQAGGLIVLQLWHVGRISDPHYLNGDLPVAPSAIAATGPVRLLRPERDYVTPRALRTEEIPLIVECYRRGAENALRAGFDGVEIHGANGYLIDQFLQSCSNHREDQYGGSIANRARFLTEVVDAVIGVWGPGRVGVHLAPRGDNMSMGDADPAALFRYCVTQLNQRGIAFICTREHFRENPLTPELRSLFNGVFIANEGFDRASAMAAVEQNIVDAVAFGKPFISNPDLPLRLQQDLPLTPFDVNSFYTPGARGYTDYLGCGGIVA